VLLVRQGPLAREDGRIDGLADREIRLPENLGFAAATNRGIAAARGRYVATVNDDALVEEGWLAALLRALDETPGAAAAQGVNLQDEARVDGWGLAWNRAVQAVQLGRDAEPPPRDAPPRPVFGVSATAALYRRSALLQVARPARARAPDGEAIPEVFDSRLESYYEDADLARRLRAAGHTALSVPGARAVHAGSLTGRRLGARRWRLLYGNRYAVAAGLLGRELWLRLPRMLARDLADLARAKLRLDGRRVLGIPGGWCRALRLLPRYVHGGPPCPGAFAEGGDGSGRMG
jgi:GT2 family glycosyltransferase